jgi:diguanylate cyclase (GGDEF)-like protein
LPNRLLFRDRIKQAIAQGQRYKKISALLSMRIEVVKRTGEPYGPEVHHEVFKRVSQRLASILRCTDTVVVLGPDKSPPTVSRLGSDEFGILLTELEDAESVTWIVKRISDGLSAPMEVAKREVQLGTTIGISIFPYDGDTPEDLLKNANTARDHAKDGKKRYWFHSREANERASEQICIEDRLRRAIEHEEFVLHYQPMVDVTRNRITSFEALIRWEDPHKGLIAPSEFIPVAERTGLINTIGKWVLRTACEQAKAWVESGFPDLRIAVNLSPTQFQQRELIHEVRTILDETGLDPHHLELEITEGVIMVNIDAAILTMQELADMGVNFAIDDFGTGYSSLSYLRMFPVDSFKIDRSFLQDVFSDARCKGLYGAIVAIARSLGLKIVAEGIETHAQLAFVREMQCDEMQGYLFSKPVPAQAATDLLQNMTKPLPTSSLQLANSLCLRDATAGG